MCTSSLSRITLGELRFWAKKFGDNSEIIANPAPDHQDQGRNPVLLRLAHEHWNRLRTSLRWQAQAIDWSAEAKGLLVSIENMPVEFFLLDANRRRTVHIKLCEYALEIWIGFIQSQGKLEYVESITGTHQVVDPRLPEALQAAIRGESPLEIPKRYLEPITALQDDDLEFPENITFSYYAIYNLYKKYALHEPVEDWLIVNQALAANVHVESRLELLISAINTARQ